MQKSVLGSPSHMAHLSKTGFNMSQEFFFTSSVGHLLPVYYDILNPGEKVQVDFTLFTRTQPVTTAAMTEIDEYVELFFVPFKKIFSSFNQAITQVSDLESSLVDSTGFGVSTVMKGFEPLNYSSENYANDVKDKPSPYGSWFDHLGSGAIRLLDHLGQNSQQLLDASARETAYTANFSPSLALICAYQAIYFDYYRLSEWENNDIKAYNIDDHMNKAAGTITPTSWVTDWLKRFYIIRYRPYQKDYFKAVHPAPLLGTAGALNSAGYGGMFGTGLRSNGINDSLYPVSLNSTGYSGALPAVSAGMGFTSTDSTNTVRSKASVGDSAASIRATFALEKLMRIQAIAGKHYDDQVLAHFGFKVPKGVANESYFIGQHHQVLTIGEILSTAETEDAVLGKVAGRGYQKQSGNKMYFEAPCHGVLMAVYSAVPRQVYYGGHDKLNSLTSVWDFYQPELDKLGLQPLFGYESTQSTAYQSTRLAWQYRYMELKSKYNRATPAFSNSVSPDNKVAPFRDWLNTSRAYYDTGDVLANLLCAPTDLNNIMVVSYSLADPADNGQVFKNIYSRDPLIHQLKVSAFKTSTMSTFGIETL